MLKHAVAAVLALAFVGAAHAGKTLDAIKQRGQLVCGVNPSLPGFSAADSQGNWTGLDVDVCKALAATVLNDANKIKWVPLNASQRFAALQSGEVDILSRNTTWTLTRDASLGLHFTGTTYYDGQGFMVHQEEQDHLGQAAEGRHGVRAVGHHHREEPQRLLQVGRPEHEAGGVRDAGGDQQGLFRRPLPGLHHRCFGPRVGAQQGSRQSRRPRHPARADLQGAAWPQRAPRRRRVLRHRQVGGVRADRGRGVRHHAGQRRPDEGRQQGSGGAAHPGHIGRHRQAAGPRQGLGLPRHQGHRQLRRDLRAQRRPEVGAQAAARRQQPVEQGRLHVRARR